VTDRERFRAEALVWTDAVYRAAFSLCGDASLADDLLQATYLKAWERFEQFRPGTNCRAWLLRILRNAWVDHLRLRKPADSARDERLDQYPAAADGGDPPAWDDIEEHLERFGDERLVAAVLELGEEFRLALFLVDVEGYTHEEAAEVLEVAVGTVKSRTSRARRMIRERLAQAAGAMEGGSD
jgi:RNA polymerase sigma-70 factor (ECF subfamily)